MLNMKFINKIKRAFALYMIVSMFMLNLVPANLARAQEVESTEAVASTESTSENSPTPTEAEPSESTENPNSTEEPASVTPTPTPDPVAQRTEYIEQQRQIELEKFKEEYYVSNPEIAAMAGHTPTSSTQSTASNDSPADTSSNSPVQQAEVAENSGPSAVINDNNGSGSTNTGNSTSTTVDNTTQDNGATVSNTTNGSAVAGSNTTSYNVGNTTQSSSDANVSGTAITSVNTNLDGVMVSEFNIVDNHTGDIILSEEALQANCVSGCGGNTASASNTNNGAGSTNTANNTSSNTDNTTQNNTAGVGNTMNLSADSGSSEASFNHAGDTTLDTGNANVSANSLTFANNNLSGGEVVYAVINIYGDLEGDIILPEFSSAEGSNSSSETSNTNNGADSTNTANSTTNNTDNTTQNNDATINNELVFDANTGENSASYNHGGDTDVSTGQSSVQSNTLNIANSNITGGNYWLVLINVAGKWFGKIMGGPEGSQFAGSEGVMFEIGEEDELNVSIGAQNDNNAADSTNTANSTTDNTDNTTQNNDATINNRLDLSANTGRNDASFNSGGDTTIKTGDARIIANLVNFVNNNISGTGRLVVVVINVFDRWLGNFYGPGQMKNVAVATGGNQNQQNANQQQETTTTNSTTTTTSETQGGVAGSFRRTITSVFRKSTVSKNANVSSSTSETQKVAGISTANMNAIAKTDKISINLAWILVILPMIIVGLIGRKIVVEKVLTKRTS